MTHPFIMSSPTDSKSYKKVDVPPKTSTSSATPATPAPATPQKFSLLNSIKERSYIINAIVFIGSFVLAISLSNYFYPDNTYVTSESSSSSIMTSAAVQPSFVSDPFLDINLEKDSVVIIQEQEDLTSLSPESETSSEVTIDPLNDEDVLAKIGYIPGPISHTLDVPPDAQVATFGAGCFWGVEHIFRKHFSSSVKSASPSGSGLIDARVGYSGGCENATLPTYKQVCTNTTGHAETVQIVFDPSLVSYEELVDFFFRIHDPTTINQQGPDDFGEQYRSVIYYHTPEQRDAAIAAKERYQASWYDPANLTIVTEIAPISIFWDAEDYHQLYLVNNPEGYMCPSHYLRTAPPQKNEEKEPQTA